MIFKVTGYMDFSPKDITKKHKKQASWKRTAIIRTNCDMDKYYGWFLKKRFNLILNKNLRGNHVTIINDKMDKNSFEEAAVVFHGKPIDFYVENEPRSNGEHWWLRVWCPNSENIRELLGLSRDPYFGLHLTIGHVNDKYIDYSEYVLRQCKRFGITSNEPRMEFDEVLKQVSEYDHTL